MATCPNGKARRRCRRAERQAAISNGYLQTLFFLATKEIEIRDVKGKRDTQRKGCYPHAPDPMIEPVNATISFHDANGRMEGI